MSNPDPRDLLRREVAAAAQGRASDPDVVAVLAIADGHVETDAQGAAINATAAVEAVLADRPGLGTPPPNLGQGRSRDRQPKESGIARGRQLHAERQGKNSPIVAGRQEFI